MLIRSKFDGYSAGVRLCFKGGGGGSAKYDNLEGLYQEQANSARLLREQAEANLPGAVQSYVNETQQVLDPGYADKQAGIAAADLAGANAQERASTTRSLASMGVNPNDPRFAGSLRATETNNAARMAAGKNASRQAANNYQINVAKDAVGTFTGQSNQAATQMGNASSGLGSTYASQANMNANQSAQQANAVGSLVGAGIAGYGIANQKKDGGRIVAPRGLKRIEQHMMGGGVGSQQNQGFFQMQQIAPPPTAQQQPQGNPVGSAIGTANTVNGLYKAGAKAGGEKVAVQGAGNAGAPSTAAAAKTAGDAAAATGATPAATTATAAGGNAAAGTVAADTAGSVAASKVGEAVATKAVEAAVTDAGAGAALNAAAPAATGSLLSSGAGAALSAVSTAMPWIGAAYAVGSLLDLWNKGGEVGTQHQGVSEAEATARFAAAEQRGDIKDIRAGGKVPGEWQGNTDNVPALLTEEEHVLNAEASAMVGHDTLDAMNKQGLALRAKGYTPGRIRAGLGLKKEAA